MKLFKNSIFVCLSVLLFAQYTHCINIRYIKDTYTILKPEYKQLSPAHGPVWWEKNIVRYIYSYGLLGPDLVSRKKDGITYPNSPYSTIELTRLLFHEVQGSFNITHAPGSAATYFTPGLVGALLGEIENTHAKVQAVAQLKIKDSRKVIVVNKLQKDLIAQLNKLLDEDATYQAGVSSYNKAIAGKQDASTLQEYLPRNQSRLINALVGSLEESGFFDIGIQQAHLKSLVFYPPYTPYMILLTFLYRKAENMKNDIEVGKIDYKDYFDGLQRYITDSIFTEQGKQVYANAAWKTDTYDDSEPAIEQYLKEIKNEYNAIEPGTNRVTFLNQLYEKMVFAELTRPSEFPEIASYRRSTYKENTFADCQDTTLRNLCNIVVFDPKTNTFSLSQLKDAKPTPAAIIFYTNSLYGKPTEVENPLVHKAWNEIAQNQFYISYNRIIRLADGLQLCCAINKAITGFMLSTKELQEKSTESMQLSFSDNSSDTFDVLIMDNKKFVLVDPAKYAVFEIMPSLKNTIILMNQLFGLELYENINTQFFNSHFNNIYFPKLATKFDWKYEETVNDLDEADYNNITIRATLKTGGTFSLQLSKSHGELVVTSIVKIEPYQEEILSFTHTRITQLAQMHQLAQNAFLLNIFALYQNNRIFSGPELNAFGYYTQRLKSPKFKEPLIGHIIRSQDQPMYELAAGLIQSLLSAADFTYISKIIRDNNIAQFMSGKGYNKKIATAISQVLDAALKSSTGRDGTNVLVLFVRQDLFLDQITQAARERAKSEKNAERSEALILFEALIPKNLAHKEAIEASQQAIKSNDDEQVEHALSNYSFFVEQGQAYSEALEAAQIGMKNNNKNVRATALRLFYNLVNQGQAYKEASEAAKQAFSRHDAIEYDAADDIFGALVNQGQYKEVIEAAQSGMKNDNPRIRFRTLYYLFSPLVGQGQAYEEAFEAAQKSLKSDDANEHNQASELIKKLTEKGIISTEQMLRENLLKLVDKLNELSSALS